MKFVVICYTNSVKLIQILQQKNEKSREVGSDYKRKKMSERGPGARFSITSGILDFILKMIGKQWRGLYRE